MRFYVFAFGKFFPMRSSAQFKALTSGGVESGILPKANTTPKLLLQKPITRNGNPIIAQLLTSTEITYLVLTQTSLRPSASDGSYRVMCGREKKKFAEGDKNNLSHIGRPNQ
jgi:hypothetical protein